MFSQTIIILFVTVGLPVICLTKIILVKMQQNHEKGQALSDSDTTAMLGTLVDTVSKLQKRVSNLETIIGNSH